MRLSPIGHFVGDHLRGGPEPAQQRVLAVGGPAGQRDAVDAHRADGEDEEESDRQVGHHHRHEPVVDEPAQRPER